MQKIYSCLWFDTNAEEAVNFYLSIFQNSKINEVTHYSDAGPLPKGTVLVIRFELDGVPFIALNGGPEFKFNPAISFVVDCDTQKEIDYYWEKLTKGGQEIQCGWLTDKFGVSWQIVPKVMEKLIADDDPARANRVMQAMFPMKKLDIAKLEAAAKG